MIDDPYQVLGVSPDASPDEIKKAKYYVPKNNKNEKILKEIMIKLENIK